MIALHFRTSIILPTAIVYKFHTHAIPIWHHALLSIWNCSFKLAGVTAIALFSPLTVTRLVYSFVHITMIPDLVMQIVIVHIAFPLSLNEFVPKCCWRSWIEASSLQYNNSIAIVELACTANCLILDVNIPHNVIFFDKSGTWEYVIVEVSLLSLKKCHCIH